MYLPGSQRDLIHPLLHLRAFPADIHLELDTDGVAPSCGIFSGGQGFVEPVCIVGGNGLAIALILHDRQFIVVRIFIAGGAVKSHGDVVPDVGNESFAGHIGVYPPPIARVPDVPDAGSITAFGAEHVAASAYELESVELKCLCGRCVGSYLHPEIKAKVFCGIIRTYFVPPQCIAVGTAAHPEVAAGAVSRG